MQGAKQILSEPVPAIKKPEGHKHSRLAPEPSGKKLALQVHELESKKDCELRTSG